MHSQFIKNQLSFLLPSAGLATVLFGIHWYLLEHFASETIFFFPLWQIYVFHFVVTSLIFLIINYRLSLGKTDVFNIFILATFLKMVVSIVFLLPLILSNFENKLPDVLNFFIPYFLFLFMEVISVLKILNKK